MGTNARDRASLGHRSTSVKRSSTARHARYLSSRFGSILAEPAPPLCGQWLHASGGEPDFAVTARSGVGVTLSASPSSLAAGASMTATWSDIAAPTATD